MATLSKSVKAANKVPSVRLSAQVSTSYDVSSSYVELSTASLLSIYPIQVMHSRDLKRNQREAIWALYEENMYDLTKPSSFGWDPEAKRKELFHSLARYILVTDPSTNNIVAFTNFRFELEEDEDIIYCYELQVSPSAQGMGFGRNLLKELEKLGTCYNMEKIMLTVLKANVKAMGFYHSVGFEVDPSSPDYVEEEGESISGSEFDYKILSRTIPETTNLA